MCIRFNDDSDVCDVKTTFVAVTSSDLHGADGLLDSFKKALKQIGLTEELIKEKLLGVTTDGEAANTGKNEGLWEKIKAWLGRLILTIWCVWHRSNLAIEDVDDNNELTLWKANITGLATYYRTSGNRTKALNKLSDGKARKFPKHHDI